MESVNNVYEKSKNKVKYNFQRFEIKYLLSIQEINRLYGVLMKNNMIRDPFLNKGKDYYTVSSLYFDNLNLMCYNEKINGLKQRTKLRFRIYDNNLEDVFLEIKRKYDAIIIKDRANLEASIYNKIITNELMETKNTTINKFIMHQRMHSMFPVAFVKYKRKPLISKFDSNLRITFDYELEACRAKDLFPQNKLHAIYPYKMVMEIKFNNSLPSWLHKIIQNNEMSREAISKYCLAIEAIKN